MKLLKFIYLTLLSSYSFSQTNIDLLIEPDQQNRIYVNEKIEFKCFLINKSNEKYYVPARNLTEYPETFVSDDFDLFGPDGNEIIIKSAPGGTGSGTSHPAQILAENGGKVKTRSFFYTFPQAGKYKLVFKYHLDKDQKPANATTEYKSFDAKTELEFEVFNRIAFPLEFKKIDFETYKKEPQIKDLTKANDSTNVFNLFVSNLNEKELEGIAKYKNLRGLTIYAQNLQQLPNTIFDLDLFEFTLVLTSTETSTIVDLSKISNFKNLRTLTINIAGKVLLVEDFAVLEHLKELTLVGFTNAINIKSLPKAELTKLDFSNLNGLSGIDGNFSDFKKLGRLSFESIQNFTMPAKFSGNIWDLKLNANAFSTFPDLTQLVLSRIEFITFTGTTLPENFQSYLKPGAQVFFPREMVNSKDYAKLKKAGFTLFPKSN